MFKPGNKFGKGRPKIQLDKPELLLPIIFRKGKINWANDFIGLYKKIKLGNASPEQKNQFKMYLDLMPYLCTKVNVKELDFSKWTTPEDKKAMTDQTASLIHALEEMNAKPPTAGSGKTTGVEDRPA